MPKLLPDLMAETDWDALLGKAPSDDAPDDDDDDTAALAPAAPVTPAVASPPAPAVAPSATASAATRLAARAKHPDYSGALAGAQSADAEERRKAAFEAGLDMMAFRKPAQARDVGTPNQDALMKTIGIQRQGAQDDRQAGQDEMASFLNDAKVKAYLAKANAAPKLDKVQAKLDADKLDATGVQDILWASYGDQLQKLGYGEAKIRGMTKDAAHRVLDEMQKSRAISHVDTRSQHSLAETSRGHDIAEKGLGIRETELETHLGQNRVAGWDESKPLQPSQAKDFADQNAGLRTIRQLTGEAKQLLVQNAGVDMNPNSPVMTSLRQKLAALYPAVVKSGGYGTLTQGHQHLLDLAIGGDPGELSNYIRNVLNPSRLPRMMDDIAHEADMQVSNQAEALGLRRSTSAPTPGAAPADPGHRPKHAAPAPPSAPSGKVRMKSPDGKTYRIDASEVPDAEKHNWKRVE